MVVWQGYGSIIGIIGIICLLGAQQISTNFFDPNLYSQSGWPKLLGFVLAGVITFFASKKIEEMKKVKHTLFFIPIKFWTFIYIGIGVVLFFI